MYTVGLYVFWVVPVFTLLVPQAFSVFWLSLWYYFLYPLQGFYNFLVFLHPKCKKYQQQRPGSWLTTVYLRILFPLGVLKPFWLLLTNTPLQETQGEDEEYDDGIGFNSFNEDAPSAEG